MSYINNYRDMKEFAKDAAHAVAEVYNTSVYLIKSKSRQKPFPDCRKIIARLVDESYPGVSLGAKAHVLGYNHNSVVREQIRAFNAHYESEEGFRTSYHQSLSKVKAGR